MEYVTAVVWPPRLGERVFDSQRKESSGKQLRAIGCPIVCDQAFDGHAQGIVMSHRSLEELHCREFFHIGVYLDKAHP